jgi:hypothetical protein
VLDLHVVSALREASQHLLTDGSETRVRQELVGVNGRAGTTRATSGTGSNSRRMVKVAMGDRIYGDKVYGDKVSGNKIVQSGSGLPTSRPERAVVLVMSADAGQGLPLRLDEERREIVRAVRLADADDRIEVRTADAVRIDDLQNELQYHRPVIAHFSGHGSATGIVVVDDAGQAQSVPPQALSDLFALVGGLRCVVLNACFTDEQARAIASRVPFVVGMRGRVLDDTAIRFAAGFYQGIAHARSARDAFELGCNRLNLHGHADADVPRLLARPGASDRPIIDRSETAH